MIVCRSLNDATDLMFMLPGATTDECGECEQLIAVSPRARALMQKDPRPWLLRCDGCLRRVPEDDISDFRAVPGALDDLHSIGLFVDLETEEQLVEWARQHRLGR